MPSILIAIAHFHSDEANRKYGSTSESVETRAAALKAALQGLYRCLGPSSGVLNIEKRAVDAGPERHSLDVVIVTEEKNNVLSSLDVPAALYTAHYAGLKDPRFLGFECQRLLASKIGKYDFYGYMEDDLIIHDPYFLRKIAYFTRTFGNDKVLQPNRFEKSLTANIKNFYIDGPLRPHVLQRHKNINHFEILDFDYLGERIEFQEAMNPHSGCYFLNAAQLEHWAAQHHFGSDSQAFVGPLESGATLGILKTFRVFKTLPQHCDFLEIEHYSSRFISMLR